MDNNVTNRFESDSETMTTGEDSLMDIKEENIEAPESFLEVQIEVRENEEPLSFKSEPHNESVETEWMIMKEENVHGPINLSIQRKTEALTLFSYKCHKDTQNNMLKYKFQPESHLQIDSTIKNSRDKLSNIICRGNGNRSSSETLSPGTDSLNSNVEDPNTSNESEINFNYELDKTNTTPKKLSHNKTLSDNEERPYKCDVCDKSFLKRNHLVEHLVIHSEQRPFQCEKCDKSFNRKGNLKLHNNNVHSGERPFICNICSKTFKMKRHLTRHYTIHINSYPFMCNICNKRFKRSENLKQHLPIHSSARPFQCDLCDRGFVSKSRLVQHRVHHSDERPFVCDICNRSFHRKTNLRGHVSHHVGIDPSVYHV